MSITYNKGKATTKKKNTVSYTNRFLRIHQKALNEWHTCLTFFTNKICAKLKIFRLNNLSLLWTLGALLWGVKQPVHEVPLTSIWY